MEQTHGKGAKAEATREDGAGGLRLCTTASISGARIAVTVDVASVEPFGDITPPEVITDMNDLNQGLEDGDMRTFPKCGEVKPDTDFDAPMTVSGRRRHCKGVPCAM